METLRTIQYYPELREYVGSINAVLIVSHLERCFQKRGEKFSKFMEPCEHFYYKPGESWTEVLHMTGTEFRTAFKHIGTVYKSKREYNRSQDKFQGKMYLSYYDRISKLTYYMRNDALVKRVFAQYLEGQELNASNQVAQNGMITEEKRTVNEEALVSVSPEMQNITIEEIDNGIEKDMEKDTEKDIQKGIQQISSHEAQWFKQDEWANMTDCESIDAINHDVEDGINNNKTNELISLENNKTNNKTDNKTQSKTNTNTTQDYIILEQDSSCGEEAGGYKIHKHQECEGQEIFEEYQEGRVQEVSEEYQEYQAQGISKEYQECQAHEISQKYQGAWKPQELQEQQENQVSNRHQFAQEPEQEKDFAQTLEVIKDLFNHICYSHDEILEWTDTQEQKIGQLWWLYDHNLEIFKTVFEKIEMSDFLSGRIKNWKASLDWILMPTHFADILADKYKNFRKPSTKVDASKGEESEDRWDFDEIERLEARLIDQRLNNGLKGLSSIDKMMRNTGK